MSQANAMSNQNMPSNGLPPHFNGGAGENSSESSRTSSPLTALRSQIPSSQLPPGLRAPIPSTQLPPTKPNVVPLAGNPNVAQLTQDYGNLQINRANTPQSSPKMSTSTPDVKASNAETQNITNFNHSNIVSPITSFTHSATGHFQEGLNGNHQNGDASSQSQPSVVPSNINRLPQHNSLPGTNVVRPPLQPSMSQPNFQQVPLTTAESNKTSMSTPQVSSANFFQNLPPQTYNQNNTVRPNSNVPNTVQQQPVMSFGFTPQQQNPNTQTMPSNAPPTKQQSFPPHQTSAPKPSFPPSSQRLPPRQQSFPTSSINQQAQFAPTSQPRPLLPSTQQTSTQPQLQPSMPSMTTQQRPFAVYSQPSNMPPQSQVMHQPPTQMNQNRQPHSQPLSSLNQPPQMKHIPLTTQSSHVNQNSLMNQPSPMNQAPPMNQPSSMNQASQMNPPPPMNQPSSMNQPPLMNQPPQSSQPYHINQPPPPNQQMRSFPNQQPQSMYSQLPPPQQSSSFPIQQQPSVFAPQNYQHPASAAQIPPTANQNRGNRYPQMPTTNVQQQSRPGMQTPYQTGYTSRQDNVFSSGFSKIWGGGDNIDLLQMPNILPLEKLEAPKITLGNENLDTANCSTDIFRSTVTKIPESAALLQKSRLPLGILIHPFRDLDHLPVIQCNTIVRCRACRTYINPFIFFVDNKRWKCNLCYRVNELPEEFMYDPISKTYGDPSRRPEVKSSTIEYIAPAEYMLRPPQPAIYLFLLDISRAAIESGYLHTYCNTLSAELSNLPGDKRTQVGFIAYDSALHFFSLAEGLSQPHEMTVLDIDDVFLPCPDNLLVNLQDRVELITDLLTQLPNRYNTSYDTGSALGSALQAAHKLLHATGGRVTVFQASLPTLGPGALLSREDPNKRNTAETTHLNPATDFYKRLALDCSAQQIAVDLFILNSHYVDLATISGISRFSGGCMHHFPLFKSSRSIQNENFERCLRRYLVRKIGFEAVMRIRCTRGLSIHTFHGNFFVRSTDLLSLPNVNPDAGYGMQVAIEETLSDVQTVCFQAALLYTSSKGERRIRVHTLCLPVCQNLTEVINSADQQCIIGLLSKMAVDRSMQSSLADAREAFMNVAIDILSSYKLSQNLSSGMSGLMAPNCLRILPLYISAILKSTAFRIGVSTRLDDRVKAMCDMKTKPLQYLIQQIYPDLYPLHKLMEDKMVTNIDGEQVPSPPHLQLTARSLDSNGAYLLDTGDHMVIYVGPAVSYDFLNQALGVSNYQSISEEMFELPVLENEFNRRLHAFVNDLNENKPYAATIQIIRDNSANRNILLERLVEDRLETALSYHEFLQHLKTQVK